MLHERLIFQGLVRTAGVGLVAASLLCVPRMRAQTSQFLLTQAGSLWSVKPELTESSLAVLGDLPPALGSVSTPLNLPPDATLDLSPLLPPGHGELTWTTIAFVSENTITVGLCSESMSEPCSLSLLRRSGARKPHARGDGLR